MRASGQQAYVLISVVVSLFIVAAISLLLSKESAMAVGSVTSRVQKNNAEYMAQAALQHARWQANNSNCNAYSLPATSFAAGNYTATYSPDSGSPVDLTVKAVLNSGAAHSIERRRVAVYQGKNTLVLQPDATKAKDSYIRQWVYGYNYGINENLLVNGLLANYHRSLMQFDLSQIHPQSHIMSAKLELYSNTDGWSPTRIEIRRLTSEWQEGNNDAGTGTVSWVDASPGVPWNNAGGDFDPKVQASAQSPGEQAWVSWDVTELVQEWVSGVHPNQGLILRATELNKGAQFSSSDDSDSSFHPRLTVVYACECGKSCADSPTTLEQGLLLSTAGDVSGSGIADMDAWSKGEVLSLGDPNFSLEPGVSSGTLSQYFKLDSFASDSDANIDAMHLLQSDITVGTGSPVNLFQGDLLLSTTDAETLASENLIVVDDADVFVFRPSTAGVYSSGNFLHLIDPVDLYSNGTVAISLVEQNTTVGGVQVPAGTFLLALSGQGDILTFSATTLGLNNTSGTLQNFISGSQLGLSNGIGAIDLFETDVIMGGQNIAAGTILLSTNDDGSVVGSNNLPVNSEDLFYLQMNNVGTNPSGTATLLFEGFDMGLSTSAQHLRAVSLSPPVDANQCNPDYTPDTEVKQFLVDSYYASTGLTGMAYLPVGKVFNGVAAGADGGWLILDPGNNAIHMVDMNGMLQTSLPISGNYQGISYVESGLFSNHLVLGTNANQIVFYTMDGAAAMTLSLSIQALSVSYIGQTSSGNYDVNLAIVDRSTETLHILTQMGAELHSFSVEDGTGAKTRSVQHISGTDLVMIAYDDSIGIYNLDGSLVRRYAFTSFSLGVPEGAVVHPLTCQHVILDVTTNTVRYLKNTGDLGGSYYLDEFPHYVCDSTVEYHGSNGTLDWSTTPWQEVGDDGRACGADFRATEDPDVPDAASLRLRLKNKTRYIQRLLDLNGYDSAWLSFDYRRRSMNGSPVWVEMSTDAINWDLLTELAAGDEATYAHMGGMDLSAYTGADAYLRYRVDGSFSGEAYIDKVKVIVGKSGGTGGGTGGGPEVFVCDGTYADYFDTRSFSNSNGSIDWSGNPWIEIGESDGANSGDINVVKDTVNFQLRTRDNDNGGEGVERKLDLSGASSAVLTYQYRRDGLDNPVDYTTVEISQNGQAGPWVELARHQGAADDANYLDASHDISSYISNDTWIRIKTSANMGNTDAVWFDNVQIQCAL